MPADPYNELKQYIRETLGVKISELTGAFNDMSRVLKDIEVKMTTRTAELQKDVNELYKEVDIIKLEIKDVKRSIEQEEATRQFLSNENRGLISSSKNEQVAKWETQIKINENLNGVFNSLKEKFDGLRNVMWSIFVVVIGILITAVWQMIIGGGAGALIK